MLTPARAPFAVAIILTALLASAGPAWSDGGFVDVRCGDIPKPGCAVQANRPGNGPAGQRVGTPATPGICRDRTGRPAPCYRPGAR